MLSKIKNKGFFICIFFSLIFVCSASLFASNVLVFANNDNALNTPEASFNPNEVNDEPQIVQLKDGIKEDYLYEEFNNDNTDEGEYYNYYMFSINKPSSIYTWENIQTDKGLVSKDRYWQLSHNVKLKDLNGGTETNAIFTLSYLPPEDSSKKVNRLVIDCVSAGDTSKHIKISCYCVLHDGSKATYGASGDSAPTPIVVSKENIKYELSNIAYICVNLRNNQSALEAMYTDGNKYVSSEYPNGFKEDPTVAYCADAESAIHDYINKIKANDFWAGYLSKLCFKLEDLDFKNLVNARNVLYNDKNYTYYMYLCPDYFSNLERFSSAAELNNYIIDYFNSQLVIAKASLKSWFNNMINLDKYNVFSEYSKNLDNVFNAIDNSSTFDELFDFINADPFLRFMFYRATIDNDDNINLAEERVMRAIQLYRTHGKKLDIFDAIFDVNEYLYESSSFESRIFECWNSFFRKWFDLNNDPDYVTVDQVPSNLQNTNSLCIAVHGYALNDDGTMQQEYIDRLDMAYNTWLKYPNSYIAIMGGGTAKNNPNITEAGIGTDYLLSKGIIKDTNIICEDKSLNTIENVKYLMNILSSDKRYTHINQLCVCSSDYHIRRCAALWESMSEGAKVVPEIYNNNINKDLQVVSNVSSSTTKEEESISSQGLWVERLMFVLDFSSKYTSIYPSSLNEIFVNGIQECYVNETFMPQVFGDFTRDNNNIEPIEKKVLNKEDEPADNYQFIGDVSSFCDVECDTSCVGKTLCTVTMIYNYPTQQEFSTSFYVDVKDRPILEFNNVAQTHDILLWMFISLFLLCFASVSILIAWKIKQSLINEPVL